MLPPSLSMLPTHRNGNESSCSPPTTSTQPELAQEPELPLHAPSPTPLPQAKLSSLLSLIRPCNNLPTPTPHLCSTSGLIPTRVTWRNSLLLLLPPTPQSELPEDGEKDRKVWNHGKERESSLQNVPSLSLAENEKSVSTGSGLSPSMAVHLPFSKPSKTGFSRSESNVKNPWV